MQPQVQDKLIDYSALVYGIAFSLAGNRNLLMPPDHTAQQGARANDHGCHAACYLTNLEMKPQNRSRHAARGAPATVVAHL